MKLEQVDGIIYKNLIDLQVKVSHRIIREKSMDSIVELFGKTNILLSVVFPTQQRFIQLEDACYWSDNADKVFNEVRTQTDTLHNLTFS